MKFAKELERDAVPGTLAHPASLLNHQFKVTPARLALFLGALPDCIG